MLYSRDFNTLWNSIVSQTPVPFPVDIEWDHHTTLDWTPPVRPVEPEEWLTPIHWAICAKKKWPHAEITIRFHGVPAVIAAPSRSRSAFLKLIFDLHPSCRSWLRLIPEDNSRQGAPFGTVVSEDELCNLFRDEFTSDRNADDRHGIHNLILPLILNYDALIPPAPTDPDCRKALLAILNTLGLIRRSRSDQSNSENMPFFEVPTTIHLVDDQAHHGWGDWVRSVLIPADNLLIPSLEEFLQGVADNVSAATDPKGNYQWDGVVLLDLRLGVAFTRKVVEHFITNADGWWLPRAEAFNEPVFQNLSADLETLRAETLKPDPDFAGPCALTLPARLFALMFPRTPIILFSSTQNAQNIRPLEGFSNILTEFTKGTVSRIADPDFVESTTQSLRRSIARAKELIHISKTADSCTINQKGKGQSGNTLAGVQEAHVELYLDESRADPMTVGGVVAVFVASTTKKAVEKAHNYSDACLTKYISAFDFGTQIRCTPGLSEMERVERFRKSWADNAHCAPHCVSRIGLAGHSTQADLITRVVEVFISLVLPALKQEYRLRSFTFSIFLPTRTVPTVNVKPNSKMFPYPFGGNQFPYRFGVGMDQGRVFLTSDDLASKVADDAIARFAPKGFGSMHGMLQQALTVRLAYKPGYDRVHKIDLPVHTLVHHGNRKRERMQKYDSPADRQTVEAQREATGWKPDVRALHYLADIVVGHGGQKFVDVEPWSCWDMLDEGTRTVLHWVQQMNRADDTDHGLLGRCLFQLSLSDGKAIPKNSLRRLALSNLRRIVRDDDWEKVVATAFRGGRSQS